MGILPDQRGAHYAGVKVRSKLIRQTLGTPLTLTGLGAGFLAADLAQRVPGLRNNL